MIQTVLAYFGGYMLFSIVWLFVSFHLLKDSSGSGVIGIATVPLWPVLMLLGWSNDQTQEPPPPCEHEFEPAKVCLYCGIVDYGPPVLPPPPDEIVPKGYC